MAASAALGTDDLSDLFFHHLGEDVQADVGRQGPKGLPARRPPAPRAASYTRGGSGRSRRVTACSAGTVSFTVVLLRSRQIAPNAASGNGRIGRTAVFKFYGLRDNLGNGGRRWQAGRRKCGQCA